MIIILQMEDPKIVHDGPILSPEERESPQRIFDVLVGAADAYRETRTEICQNVRPTVEKIWNQLEPEHHLRFEGFFNDVRFYIREIINLGTFPKIGTEHEVVVVGLYVDDEINRQLAKEERESIEALPIPIISFGFETGVINWFELDEHEVESVEEFLRRVKEDDEQHASYFKQRNSFDRSASEYSQLKKIENSVGNYVMRVSPSIITTLSRTQE